MASRKVTPSDGGCVSAVTIPAEYADDFRAAIVEEIALETKFIGDHRKKADEYDKWDDAKAASERADMREDMGLLAEDAALLLRVAGRPDDIEAEWSNTAEAEALAHVFETMARRIVGPRLSENLEGGPMDGNACVELVPLMQRLAWTVERAAEMHRVAVEVRKQNTEAKD